ncbi:efflux RND transporter periplasmic adaptor subunit [Poseidonocella sp. HB161398]|uniref:efflux RND transporter periplasmic adaptor subunit n=1 Tax=Poseidonocella sp. HB161398 TaxID=2320855 RepID=UPI001109B316|nr:HlyD family efflux transporter periplasmic adaptor subunit [Poseidonocella sp. HB161398]
MSTRTRLFQGLAMISATLLLLALAGGVLWQAARDGALRAAPAKTPKERLYAVQTAILEPEDVVPEITAYGTLASGRSLELRAQVAGEITALSPNFREGGRVAAGEVLFRVDPARLETAAALARTDLAEAEATLAETRAALDLARLEAAAAEAQLALRSQALKRQEGLRDRGVGTAADVEAAGLARAAADQLLINRRQVVAGGEARVAQAGILLDRARIALADAENAVEDATYHAPFAGVIDTVSVSLGALVSAGGELGTLIDPSALEAAFRVTNTQFARLLGPEGWLPAAEVAVTAQRSGQPIPAVLDRAGAANADGQVGRLLFARLEAPDPRLVRPGDFVTVLLKEAPLSGVAVIPAAAASADGRILLVGEDNRLAEAEVRPLRLQGDMLVVGDAPFGSRYVLARSAQLGAGLKVEPVAAAPETTAAPPAPPPPDTLPIDDARRAAIIAYVEASTAMKPENRATFLEELSRPEVPRATVERLEAKMAEGR